MIVFITVITLFPVIVTLLLRGKYSRVVIVLAILNLIVFGTAYHSFGVHYLLVLTANIILAVIIWYLAFKRREDVLGASSPVTAAELSSQIRQQKGLRILLTSTGWLIVLVILLVIVGFVVALSAM